MAVLVNGDAFKPVTAQMDADFYAGIWGSALSVISVGGCMAASIESATTIRIADGEAVIQGRRIHIDAGTYDEFTIPIGEQGTTKYYIIGYELYRDGENKELCRTFVQEVNSSSATVPTGGNLRDGATSIKVAMYRITKNGVNIGSAEPLFETPRVVRQIFPVGAIYISASPTNPSEFFGGTWEQITGRFLLSADTSHAAGTTGGAASHTLTQAELPAHAHSLANHTHTVPAHTHSASTASAGAHTHSIARWMQATPTEGGTGRLAQGSIDSSYVTSKAGAHTHSVTVASKPAFNTAAASGNTGSTGSGTAISMMPPYLAVYMWKRTA